MNNKIILFFIILLIITNTNLKADEDVLRPRGKSDAELAYYKGSSLPLIFGFEAGVNFNIFSQTISWNPNYRSFTIFDCLNSGTGFSPHFGFLFDIPISKKLSFQARISYDRKSFGNSGLGTDTVLSYSIVNIGVGWDLTNDYVATAFLLRYNIDNNWFATFGPTIHFMTSNLKVNKSGNTGFGGISPDDCYYYQFVDSVFLMTKSPTMFGLELGFGYKFPITQDIFLVPQARFQLSLSQMFEEAGINDIFRNVSVIEFTKRYSHSLQLAIALWFNI